MDEYDRRFDAAVYEMKDAGLWAINSNPPYVWFLKALRYPARPLHYVPLWKVFIGQGLFFATVMGFVDFFMITNGPEVSVFDAILRAGVAGSLFGLFMAGSTLYTRKRNNLSQWVCL